MRTARLARIFDVILALPAIAKMLLRAAGTRLAWLRAAPVALGNQGSPEPPSRRLLLADVQDAPPSWASLSRLCVDVEAAAWDRALMQHRQYRSFLQQALWGRHAAFVRCVLDACALHQDFTASLDAVRGDSTRAARLRAAFASAERGPPEGARRDELQATFKRLWAALLRGDAEMKRLLLLDIWTAPGHNGERLAAAFAVYGMFLMDFLRAHAKLRPEFLADSYKMVESGAFAAAELKRAPDAWRAQLAALHMGRDPLPKMRR